MTHKMRECSVTRRKPAAQHADNAGCFCAGVKDGLMRASEKATLGGFTWNVDDNSRFLVRRLTRQGVGGESPLR